MTKVESSIYNDLAVSGFEFEVISSRLNYLFFDNIDGKSSIYDIFNRVRVELGDLTISNDTLLEQFSHLYNKFQQLDWILLKSK